MNIGSRVRAQNRQRKFVAAEAVAARMTKAARGWCGWAVTEVSGLGLNSSVKVTNIEIKHISSTV